MFGRGCFHWLSVCEFVLSKANPPLVSIFLDGICTEPGGPMNCETCVCVSACDVNNVSLPTLSRVRVCMHTHMHTHV